MKKFLKPQSKLHPQEANTDKKRAKMSKRRDSHASLGMTYLERHCEAAPGRHCEALGRGNLKNARDFRKYL